MNENGYTPTTDRVRESYVFSNGSEGEGWSDIDAEFDRWLAAHDAEMRAKIAEEIFNEEQVAMRRPNPTDPFRNGFILGLQRARDIAAARKEGTQ